MRTAALALLLATGSLACGAPEPAPAPAPDTTNTPAASAGDTASGAAPGVAPVPSDDTSGAPNKRFDPTAPDTAAATVSTTGTVRRVEVEGGGWVIDTPDGTFQPVALDAAYQKDGMRVSVTLRPRPDMMSTLMSGTLADVVSIKAR